MPPAAEFNEPFEEKSDDFQKKEKIDIKLFPLLFPIFCLPSE
jgi:hypothetical protein